MTKSRNNKKAEASPTTDVNSNSLRGSNDNNDLDNSTWQTEPTRGVDTPTPPIMTTTITTMATTPATTVAQNPVIDVQQGGGQEDTPDEY